MPQRRSEENAFHSSPLLVARRRWKNGIDLNANDVNVFCRENKRMALVDRVPVGEVPAE